MNEMTRSGTAFSALETPTGSQSDVERTSVAALVAASVEFSKQPLQERHVVLAKGGGYTFAVQPLQPGRSKD